MPLVAGAAHPSQSPELPTAAPSTAAADGDDMDTDGTLMISRPLQDDYIANISQLGENLEEEVLRLFGEVNWIWNLRAGQEHMRGSAARAPSQRPWNAEFSVIGFSSSSGVVSSLPGASMSKCSNAL